MSEPGKVDRAELEKVGRGALIAAAGAGLTYLTAWITGANFGDWTPVIVAAWAIAANAARKYIGNNPKEQVRNG